MEEQLARFLDDRIERSGSYGAGYRLLWSALGRATEAGKRFRPILLQATYRALGGRDDQIVAHVGAAIELLHTAFVIHDDVIDGDLVRRGSANVSGTFVDHAREAGAAPYRCAALGLTAGVLAGDLALVGATRMVALCGADRFTTDRLLDLLDHAVYTSAAGELSDVILSLEQVRAEPVSLDDVITMEEQKTAVYSFELPMQAGGVLAGADEEMVRQLGQVGRLAGIGFQLVDDLLGVFGDESRTGKSSLSDLREGKMTALMAHARTTAAWPQIASQLGDPRLDASRARLVREMLVQCGSRSFVETMADSYLSAAVTAGAHLGLPEELVAGMTALTQDLIPSAA